MEKKRGVAGSGNWKEARWLDPVSEGKGKQMPNHKGPVARGVGFILRANFSTLRAMEN